MLLVSLLSSLGDGSLTGPATSRQRGNSQPLMVIDGCRIMCGQRVSVLFVVMTARRQDMTDMTDYGEHAFREVMLAGPWSGRAIPERLGHEKKEQYTTKGATHRNYPGQGSESVQARGLKADSPEYPSPTQRVDDSSACQRGQVFTAKEEKGVYAQAVSSFVEEEDLGNGGRRQCFDRGSGNAHEDTGNHQGRIIGGSSTPQGTDYKQYSTDKVNRPLSEEDGGW